jgi:predicted dehydrogenase
VTRRQLITAAAVAASPAANTAPAASRRSTAAKPAAETMAGVPFERRETVRIGFVGLGGRGSSLLGNLLACEGVRVPAVCDVRPERARRAAERIGKSRQPTPETYTDGDHAYEALCRRDDLDLVLVATPWEWHVPMAVAAMTHGKHAAVEVPAATTLDDCWTLVDTSEKTRRHCVMLENCCYGRSEMQVLRMARAGLFGELVHGEAAYIHDLRAALFDEEGEGNWRRAPHVRRDGNLYPTHGLGPVARYLVIHEGDRFVRLVSMSSREAGLTAWREAHVAAADPRRREVYRCGDVNTSLLKTEKGRTVVLQHIVTAPRPYDRVNLLQGTRGAFRDYPERIYLDGVTPNDDWEPLDKYRAEWDDPLWRDMGELARRSGGHGGMDFLMCYRLVRCLREGLAPEMDVYDAAAWSAPGPLSDASVAKNGAPVAFPDFTRGRWQGNGPAKTPA